MSSPATKLMVMTSAPADGWSNLVGTYWVCRGKKLKHVTERQSTIELTMKSLADVAKYFEEASSNAM